LKKECGLPTGVGQGALAAEQLEPDKIRDVQGRNYFKRSPLTQVKHISRI
jgi:hypothetical protein